MTKFNQLQTKDEFAKLLGLKSDKYINYLLYNIQTDNLYTTFTIPNLKRMVEKELYTLLKKS